MMAIGSFSSTERTSPSSGRSSTTTPPFPPRQRSPNWLTLLAISTASSFLWSTSSGGVLTNTNIKKIKAATDVGPSSVEGVTCEQYAFRQEGVDWQIWVELGEFPLPRKLVIRTLTDDAKPQHRSVLSWNLAPSFSKNAFTFDPPADAHRISIAEIHGQATNK